MKKIACLLSISISLLCGCTSHNTQSNATSQQTTSSNDTAKKQAAAIPQPADTSIKDGPLITRYANGVIKEKSNYIAGRRNGECQYFYPTGKLQSDDFFIGGLIDGSTTVYFDNGQKEYEGIYTQGKPSGIWKFYDKTGKLVRSKDFSKPKANPAM